MPVIPVIRTVIKPPRLRVQGAVTDGEECVGLGIALRRADIDEAPAARPPEQAAADLQREHVTLQGDDLIQRQTLDHRALEQIDAGIDRAGPGIRLLFQEG